jgi:hypothetical protein
MLGYEEGDAQGLAFHAVLKTIEKEKEEPLSGS